MNVIINFSINPEFDSETANTEIQETLEELATRLSYQDLSIGTELTVYSKIGQPMGRLSVERV